MSEIFIPGWATDFTLNLVDYTVVGKTLSFVRTSASLPKAVFGSAFRQELKGQSSGTITAQGHLSVSAAPSLEAAFAAQDSLAYILLAGVDGEATEAGQWAGNMVITQLSLNTDAEDEWEFVIAGNLDGEAVYTPPTP